MAIKQTEKTSIELYRKSSFFTSIKRKDGLEWSSDIVCEYEVKKQHTDELIETGVVEKSADNLLFQLRYTNTENLIRNEIYVLIVRITDTVTKYSDVVLETTITVK